MKKKQFKIIIALAITILSVFIFGGCSNKNTINSKNKIDTTESQNILGDETLQFIDSDENFEYKVYETYVEITKYIGTSKSVIVPDEIEKLPVKRIGNNAFQGQKSNQNNNIFPYESNNQNNNIDTIVDIKLPKHLIEIGDSAFMDTALTEIVIPDDVITIENYAFQNCYLLKKITFGKSVNLIGPYSFSNCNLTETIILPEGLNIIGTNAFSNDSNSNSEIYYFNNKEYILEDFYKGENNITPIKKGDATIIIPSSVTELQSRTDYYAQIRKEAGHSILITHLNAKKVLLQYNIFQIPIIQNLK